MFGETQDIFFVIKKEEEQNINLKFQLDFKNETSYNYYKDRAYDTELIRKCINEEAKAEDQIPLKSRAKNGHYRLKSKNTFQKEIYSRRNNVESIFSVIKRIFNGTNRSRSLQLSNKETKLKNTIYNIYRTTQIQEK